MGRGGTDGFLKAERRFRMGGSPTVIPGVPDGSAGTPDYDGGR